MTSHAPIDPNSGEHRLQGLRSIATDLLTSLPIPLRLPEVAVVLDLATRRHDDRRQFKYLHEMNLLHSENFVIANQVKLVSLLDGYLSLSDLRHPLGPYLFARTILELAAFLHEVAMRLRTIVLKPENQWQTKGEEFFALIVRARFATTHPVKRDALIKEGVSEKHLKPINVMKSLEELEKDTQFGRLVAEYAKLCDFVHHNLSSHFSGSEGFVIGRTARSAGGGGILTKESGPISVYEYPLESKGMLAVDETIEVTQDSVKACVNALNHLPRTPFSAEQLVQTTGSSLGITRLSSPPHDKGA